MTARSYLFVPADRTDRFAKALAAGADEVIIDLEDAVAPAAKAAARFSLSGWLQQHTGRPVVVRINGVGTPWFEEDLPLCAHANVFAIMVPKSQDAAGLARVRAAVPDKALLPLVETVQGFDQLRQIAFAPQVQRLVFGAIDFQLDAGIDGDGDELLLVRSTLVLQSRLAGIAAPVDGPSLAIGEGESVFADTRRARRQGFGAKLCIHPRQVEAVHRAFTPTTQELAWAQRVLDACALAQGAAAVVDGKMIDAPVVRRARALLGLRLE
ncbi:MAG: CoA ester lyase [Haliea sp.]|nr:MAG: CoA ester lyase [Haliea sp.]